ncbi:NAD(P)H-quinone oxidoreductase subunit L, chloroplastic-like [Zingiber officinale]|nr:NAD(P)H-quinone oxidoreductase subunit L, chloroplastic-like [Zingiber officinale]XP_042427095.1 NAD(P)H-quinone oxidoreductase subunit L, chloroplastic-like [Zingiber officinale]XP_042427096.1 NAD(P)H-quinone oxidoreductase subunit L, chloroplastic-like [Zingiber officinale]XP_042427097.1 NAD(P)H-quinone oxidoreductase subunit L, chloroplastic-like [Zingiber officinale]XP_042427098.1 NAD(P)H-quinone oxidoreductase subunit L, chloroplastic-like [Zingiber officinale]XP_042427099.1 NAD(P)H-qu
MSNSWTFVPATLHCVPLLRLPRPSLSLRPSSLHKHMASCCAPSSGTPRSSQLHSLTSLLHYGAIMAATEAPSALAVTGDNNMEDDLLTTLLGGGAILFVYLFVVPPIIMNWLRLRWYKRKFLETYLQFMFVFLFFPGLLLWAPFINFRPFPRDPTMEYPWSTPKDDVPLYKPRKLTR